MGSGMPDCSVSTGEMKREGVSGDEVFFDGLLDARHVTGGALTAGAVGSVMGVLGDGAFEACRVLCRLWQLAGIPDCHGR